MLSRQLGSKFGHLEMHCMAAAQMLSPLHPQGNKGERQALALVVVLLLRLWLELRQQLLLRLRQTGRQ